MKYKTRIYYSESQKALMWELWRKGESLQHIAQLFDRNHSSIQGILAQTGGIQPPPRRRSRRALTLAEREEISRSVVAGHFQGQVGEFKGETLWRRLAGLMTRRTMLSSAGRHT
jgi:transposase